MSLVIHVRVFVPGANTPSSSIGHYDMIIEGEHPFNGVSLTNPVFSYRASSRLEVFEESASPSYYEHGVGQYYYDCDIYKWTFTLANGNYNGFITALQQVINSCEQINGATKAFRCTLNASNPFSTYDPKKYNCFHAVAVWLYYFGNYTLKGIYDAAHDYAYLEYSPQNMANEYSHLSSWSPYSP